MGHHKQTDKKYTPGSTGRRRSKTLFTALFIRWIISMSNLRSVHVLPKRCQQEITPVPILTFCCWKYAKGIHSENVNAGAPKTEEALLNSLQEFVDHGHSNITYTVEKVEEPSGNDAAQYEQLLDKLAIRKQRAKKKHTLTVSIPKKNTGKTGN